MRLAFAAALLCAAAASAHEAASPPAPAAGAFDPPAPGTYRLPSIQLAPGGDVIDEWGKARSLAQLMHGHITLLGLIYTRCADPDGCPRATWAFAELRGLLRADRALERRVRLLSLSFDPAHDDPKALAHYARQVRGKGGADWRFLTTRSAATLAPILEALGQDVSRVPASPEAFEHTVKVFLVDPRGRVREIYSSAYLAPAVILNDIRTLDRENR